MIVLERRSKFGLDHNLDSDQIRQLVCSRFSVTMARYHASESEWAVQARCPVAYGSKWLKNCNEHAYKAIGVHAKGWVVDDVTFYLGSQNLYAVNLAEWGQIVDNALATKQLLTDFWNPFWHASSKGAASGPHTKCMQNTRIPRVSH